jgi:hypothetical protein
VTHDLRSSAQRTLLQYVRAHHGSGISTNTMQAWPHPTLPWPPNPPFPSPPHIMEAAFPRTPRRHGHIRPSLGLLTLCSRPLPTSWKRHFHEHHAGMATSTLPWPPNPPFPSPPQAKPQAPRQNTLKRLPVSHRTGRERSTGNGNQVLLNIVDPKLQHSGLTR